MVLHCIVVYQLANVIPNIIRNYLLRLYHLYIHEAFLRVDSEVCSI